MADKYYFYKDGKFNYTALIKAITILVTALILSVLLYSVTKKFMVKKEESPSKDMIPIPKESKSLLSEKSKGGISFKGRVKKVPRNINYSELFVNNEITSEKIEKQERKETANIIDLFENLKPFQNEEALSTNNEPLQTSGMKALPRNRNDLLFFDDIQEKEEIDDNLEFLKEMKKENIKEEPKIEETEAEKLIARLRNSGSFHQTEISRLNQSRLK